MILILLTKQQKHTTYALLFSSILFEQYVTFLLTILKKIA